MLLTLNFSKVVKVDDIVSDLEPNENAQITAIRPIGSTYVSVQYIKLSTKQSSSKVLPNSDFEKLTSIAQHGTYTFTGNGQAFKLYAEAERINSAYQFDPLFAVNCSIVDPLPHQVEAVYKHMLPLPKIRFMLADDTGAGKTIMTGLLIKELITRGVGDRILIITPGGLTKQWQEDEMMGKFNLQFDLVDRARFNSDPTCFFSCNRVITSIDFVAQEDILNVLSQTSWDMVVFDEAHKLSAYEFGQTVYKSRRYVAAHQLATVTDHLLLLTATPHRGRQDSFKKLCQLLDPDIFGTAELSKDRVKQEENNGLNKFFIRRLKEDMLDWEQKPLYKQRFTRTVSYELTTEEKHLYDSVTSYLTKQKTRATNTRNVQVALTLSVMQRRLASSIFAIRNTLEKRHQALLGVLDELNKSPNLWSQKSKLEEFDGLETIDDYDELNDEERNSLERLMSDPKKFKLFTTAESANELKEEEQEVQRLFQLADGLYTREQEEQKYLKLLPLLKDQKVEDGQKLVIFTEHRDTLEYLKKRLSLRHGYRVVTIHGGMNVYERRLAQQEFAQSETQILICTDAAGEGINLQFCSLLLNWDIPWNPNRLEQRMGRIHRYGQKKDVLVLNMVAGNTREGQVLQKLLTKLDIIREALGDDRVYDVIQDVMEGIDLRQIMRAVFDGEVNSFTQLVDSPEETLRQAFTTKVAAQRKELAHAKVNFDHARKLKEASDEQRLQPIYIRQFFEQAFTYLGGRLEEVEPGIYSIVSLPEVVREAIRRKYNLTLKLAEFRLCFDKRVFQAHLDAGNLAKAHYINPGDRLFEGVVFAILERCHTDMLQGAVLISAIDEQPRYGFFMRSRIRDGRKSVRSESVADERLVLIEVDAEGNISQTSPAKFVDLAVPADFALTADPMPYNGTDDVMTWVFEHVTLPHFEATKVRVESDASTRSEYLNTAFTDLISEVLGQITELESKVLYGKNRSDEEYKKRIARLEELKHRKNKRLEEIKQMLNLSPTEPEIIGCAYIQPLSELEFERSFGMKRDAEVEAIAMAYAMEHERTLGHVPVDVSTKNLGYDIYSTLPDGFKRYIEVKGRASQGDVMLSENEWNRLSQLGPVAWLYVVLNCKTTPQLIKIQDPAQRLQAERLSKGVQYLVKLEALADVNKP